ncbi:cytidine deaminase [Candidatus Neomarinimicrobiota bacterium]
MDETTRLLGAARDARKKARADYSGYAVGAALLTADGSIYQGCNIESAAYPSTICAERVAIFGAIADGAQNFRMLAIVTDDGGTPCGTCRQVILEQCGTIDIHVHALQSDTTEVYNAGDLLPRPFGGEK